MKIVRLTRDMRPNGRKGEDLVLPDALADKLIADNEAEDPRPFPPPDVAPPTPPAPAPKKPPLLKRPRDYFTRNTKRASA